MPALPSILFASMPWWGWKYAVAVIAFLVFQLSPYLSILRQLAKKRDVLRACCSVFVGACDGYLSVCVAPFLLISIWTSKVIYADGGETRSWCIFHKNNRLYLLMCCVVLCIWLLFINTWYTLRINYIPVST